MTKTYNNTTFNNNTTSIYDTYYRRNLNIKLTAVSLRNKKKGAGSSDSLFPAPDSLQNNGQIKIRHATLNGRFLTAAIITSIWVICTRDNHNIVYDTANDR